MEMIMYKRQSSPCHVAPLLALLASFSLLHTVASIGVNYGTISNNLPNPSEVAQFIKTRTIIDRVKIFDMNPDIIRAFANTGISLSITVPNDQIISLANPRNAGRWVRTNIRPFYPQTKINHLLVGNEVLHWGDQRMKDNLVGAMRALHSALARDGMGAIRVTTPHSLGILFGSHPPSQARFSLAGIRAILKPMLAFHRMTKTPFMVNPYPYFSWSPKTNNFALWRKNSGVFDKATGKRYDNVYDLLLDAVFMSMKRLGYGDVEIAVGEVGWPSAGDIGMRQTTVENAKWHNWNILRKSESGVGTPLMPGRKFETFIFALFNENLKPGPAAERNFGLFRHDFSPVYDIGIMRGKQPGRPGRPAPVPVKGKQWCVPKSSASDAQLQSAINWVCSNGLDCRAVQAGGACFNPNNVRSHATYVMNAWYQSKGHQSFNCDFSGTGIVTNFDPSTRSCKYNA